MIERLRSGAEQRQRSVPGPEGATTEEAQTT